ncbi:MAG: dihydrolipoyl dehydrogenase [Candidatus Omnitrophica bacterium CG11_big_fil_rev_8_21_14_0_20_45_26]|uniref:Dihydrolipoyl dehydrogenase n=1 Tax=Candidatus Abzuiibacterium crystallinum TaxID=1974748 RepID=A0A2H0LMF8_9BACT|nr:MAG: dihydrolipoyl dehydrogenase [Candidatus Omnitrophica bacterium CG11_big_fil_rev_8_21_14_0_20_45_26]PIW65151.1 MAG: dihydrolipoyl dehydrogenase [Candidatus Omnitrophica bacterium CG12_big_fil_rev_8_21_14_0_65_45_16]
MKTIKTEIVVLGAGPGGYAAAFYAADKGKKVILVERDKQLGGTCLLRGCIPSKALLHATEFIRERDYSKERGIEYQTPRVDLGRLNIWKNKVVAKLSDGVMGLSRRRKIDVMHGRGYFESSDILRVETSEGQKFLEYDKVIIAVGSQPALPKAFDLGNKRIMTSTEALEVEEIPKDLLVIGGGYIGMELGTVYASLGSRVVVIEALDGILSGLDADLARPVMQYAQKHFKEVRVKTKVSKMATKGKKIFVESESNGQKKEELYDRVLVSVGRVPNCQDLGLENTKVQRDDKGFIQVDAMQQTADSKIMAIGDVVGGALLAHKAAREARIAVDVFTGEENSFDNVIIPAVVFTDPEVAWCGLTEAEAKKKGIEVKVVRFPWGASGRALSLDRPDGVTKLIIEPHTERVVGVGITGKGAGELISEGVFAIEMGATARDLAESIHPHPTLSETLMESAEMFYGYATHTYAPKRSTALDA